MYECKKSCGYCCTLIVKLSLFDILRIMRAGYKRKDFMERNLKGQAILKMNNGDCCFLERKGKKTKCKIYESRPKICRVYPFVKNHHLITTCDSIRKHMKDNDS